MLNFGPQEFLGKLLKGLGIRGEIIAKANRYECYIDVELKPLMDTTVEFSVDLAMSKCTANEKKLFLFDINPAIEHAGATFKNSHVIAPHGIIEGTITFNHKEDITGKELLRLIIV